MLPILSGDSGLHNMNRPGMRGGGIRILRLNHSPAFKSIRSIRTKNESTNDLVPARAIRFPEKDKLIDIITRAISCQPSAIRSNDGGSGWSAPVLFSRAEHQAVHFVTITRVSVTITTLKCTETPKQGGFCNINVTVMPQSKVNKSKGK